MKMFKLLIIFLLLLSNSAISSAMSDAEIKKKIILESIQSYPGNCPCPYNMDRAGRKCGRRSAWSRAGGYSPLCYDSDITKDMVKKYRDRLK